MRHLPRPRELEAVRAKLRRAPITALLGHRQCGKTTLAQLLKAEHFFDLEDPRSLARLDEPQTALELGRGVHPQVLLDEEPDDVGAVAEFLSPGIGKAITKALARAREFAEPRGADATRVRTAHR